MRTTFLQRFPRREVKSVCSNRSRQHDCLLFDVLTAYYKRAYLVHEKGYDYQAIKRSRGNSRKAFWKILSKESVL